MTNLSGNTFNGLDSGNQAIWNTSYSGTPVTQTGNRYIFGTSENLTITPEATPFTVNKNAGTVANLPTPTVGSNYEISGFVDASNYNNVFTQDTINNISISSLNFISTGAPASAAAGTYDVLMSGTANLTNGYTATYNAAAVFGNVVVAPIPVPAKAYTSAANVGVLANIVGNNSKPTVDAAIENNASIVKEIKDMLDSYYKKINSLF